MKQEDQYGTGMGAKPAISRVPRDGIRLRSRPFRGSSAFTLIELLVVIAIIALLAALVVPLSKVASTKMRLARVNGELSHYATAIENYKLEAGEYPPDNPLLKTLDHNTANWTNAARFNPLYYELSGAVFTNKNKKNVFIVLDNDQEIEPSTLKTYFGVDGIRNSARDRHDRPFKGFDFREAQHRRAVTGGTEEVELLEVPVPGPQMIDGRPHGVTSATPPTAKSKFNAWYYDASSTNRHNLRSFDLWAEITIGKEVHVIGNWKS
jgi:prepilin-type N-terminal cleavage/methylation domain-containing protein